MSDKLNKTIDEYIGCKDKIMALNSIIGEMVYPYIEKKDFKTADENFQKILTLLDDWFKNRFRTLIKAMVNYGPENFERWINSPIPYKHYPYMQHIDLSKTSSSPICPPIVFADESMYEKAYRSTEFTHIKGEIKIAKSSDET